MLIQAYVTASIQSTQVDMDVTKSHSPGYLGDRMLMYFPLSQVLDKDYGIKERNSSGSKLRTS